MMPLSGTLNKYIGIGDRLRKLRGDLSQKEFSQLLGIPFRSYQRYETGESTPAMKKIGKIAQECRVEIDWILTGSLIPVEHLKPLTDYRKIPNNLVILDDEAHRQLARILHKGEASKVEAVRSLLRALDPNHKREKRHK